MAFLEVKNVRIAGFSAGVPKRIVSILDANNRDFSLYDASFAYVDAPKGTWSSKIALLIQ